MTKKKIKVKKKEKSVSDDLVKDVSEQIAIEEDRAILKDLLDSHPPGSTIADPDDGQLDFGFLDFGSFYDSSDPDDVA